MKSDTIQVPCEPGQRKLIRRAATRLGMPASTYLLAAGLAKARAELPQEEILQIEQALHSEPKP